MLYDQKVLFMFQIRVSINALTKGERIREKINSKPTVIPVKLVPKRKRKTARRAEKLMLKVAR